MLKRYSITGRIIKSAKETIPFQFIQNSAADITKEDVEKYARAVTGAAKDDKVEVTNFTIQIDEEQVVTE